MSGEEWQEPRLKGEQGTVTEGVHSGKDLE